MEQRSSLELVVARYGEALNWLRRVPPAFARTVLDKHPDAPWPGAVRLPNVGREAQSYLHFICARYDSLADWTVFCQGHPFDHAFDFHATLRRMAEAPDEIASFEWFGHIIDTDDANGARLFRGWSKNEDGRALGMGAFHRALFGSDGPDTYTFRLGGQFAVSRALIRARPIKFWGRALELSARFPDAAHCFERSWDKVLGVEGVNSDWLAGRETVYLKPIRRLGDSSQG